MMRSIGRKSISASAVPRDLMEERELVDIWTARVLTLYPDMFPGILGQSLTGRALKDKLWQLDTTDIRQFGLGKHRAVDDTPTGGGAGMVLRADVLDAAIASRPVVGPLIYLSPRGRRFDQEMARSLAAGPGVTLLCGRFEGVDERIIEARQIIEVSLGDFILTGGELAAQAMIDATVRLLPKVLGNAESIEEESFSSGLLEHPQFTRPNDWEGRTVPEVLISGHHGRIAEWRQAQSEALTQDRRPDLWAAHLARTRKGG
ncbi:tRNA (guanine37-N1)-methyltransferase [Monaibacterium marinum]|uniref:tRNA (guanine-N(1)-)-methyltransferase n=1 Tax=Pontivivens marinum TaxID=1690039 RepID=A0A2C9CSH7_9RHOB|nr:tRNA (guanosine(37)-N1)-methyltransferase TrmD [Monaibacterium marinum]SOH94217.1 tRNA (guanine37-N1)-methyltransferase [Monaibacterium marinum]